MPLVLCHKFYQLPVLFLLSDLDLHHGLGFSLFLFAAFHL
jgi:hypothetical protein